MAEADAGIRAAERRTHRDPNDAGAHERLANALRHVGRLHDAAESEHRARLLRDPKAHAEALRERVEKGTHNDQTLRHYREALHKVHPDIAKHVKLYARWDSEERSAQRNLESLPLKSRKEREEHRQHRNRRGKEARLELEEARTKNERTGHNLAHFLEPLRSRAKGDDTPDQIRHGDHLARLHRLLNRGEQGTASFWSGRIDHHHYYDEHSHSPKKTMAHVIRHNALIKHHFPNAETSISDHPQGAPPHIVVSLHNPGSLRHPS